MGGAKGEKKKREKRRGGFVWVGRKTERGATKTKGKGEQRKTGEKDRRQGTKNLES